MGTTCLSWQCSPTWLRLTETLISLGQPFFRPPQGAFPINQKNGADMIRKRYFIFSITLVLLVAASYLLGIRSGRQEAPISLDVQGTGATQLDPEAQVAFWEGRVSRDERDYISRAYLGQALMLLSRERSNPAFFLQAESTLEDALAIQPADETALALMATAKLGLHDFNGALEIAERVYAADPGALLALATIGDASLELGDYSRARVAYNTLLEKSASPPVFSRIGRLAWLQGRPDAALDWMERAAEEALSDTSRPQDKAWYLVQVGVLHLEMGRMELAESNFEAALDLYEGHPLALEGLGAIRAAQGDNPAAIAFYEKAAEQVTEPDLLAALGDLYFLEGREDLAQEMYDEVRRVSLGSELNRVIYNRQLSFFLADRDLEPELALRLALDELAVRKDIYGYDAAAWAYYKSGQYEQAWQAITEAMKQGTRDAHMFFHAGMIAYRLGDFTQARANLLETLEINPLFDPLQAEVLRQTLQEMEGA